MTTKFIDTPILEKIADMTERNYHTEARIAIASQFNYCADFYKLFQAIKTIHSFEHFLPFAIASYRDEKTDQMLRQIEATDGLEIANAIRAVI